MHNRLYMHIDRHTDIEMSKMKQRQIWGLEIQQIHWKYQQNPKCEKTIGNIKKNNKTKGEG